MENKNEKIVTDFIHVAAYLLAHPDLPEGYVGSCGVINFYPKEEGLTPADCIRKFGATEKASTESHFYVFKKIGPWSLEFNFPRGDVCERVKTGERVIPAEPEKVVTIPATPERVEEVFEWRCPDSLLRPNDEAEVLENATAEAMKESDQPATTPQAGDHMNPEQEGMAKRAAVMGSDFLDHDHSMDH